MTDGYTLTVPDDEEGFAVSRNERAHANPSSPDTRDAAFDVARAHDDRACTIVAAMVSEIIRPLDTHDISPQEVRIAFHRCWPGRAPEMMDKPR